jgi:hypothetical protein
MSTHSAECWPHTCLTVETMRRAPSTDAACGWTMIRKTSLLRKINPMMRRSSFTNKGMFTTRPSCDGRADKISWRLVIEPRELLRRIQTRINLLFTMSEIPHAHPKGHDMRSDVSRTIIFGHRMAPFRESISAIKPSGGARRDRTDDLMLAKHALSQLSYGPIPEDECCIMPVVALRATPGTLRFVCHVAAPRAAEGEAWWAWEDLNFRPHAYQARALTN